jgi:hypothetical protein
MVIKFKNFEPVNPSGHKKSSGFQKAGLLCRDNNEQTGVILKKLELS